MIKHDQNGSVNGIVISLVAVSILLVSSLGFAGWAFTERQDYKNNSDEKVSAAVVLARQDESTKKDKQFAEEIKNPFRTYAGPQAFGSLIVKYPDTWSAYVDDTGRGTAPVDAYFHLGTVPSVLAESSAFALRVKVVTQSYEASLANLRKLEKTGAVTMEPYVLPLVPEAIGIKATGEVKPDKNGTLIILPLRDRTIQISTEGDEFITDFTEKVLPNLSFAP
jgi:hypothetical protein